MGDREDTNLKKNKKSKKTPKQTFTHLQVADHDLEALGALGESSGTWLIDGKSITKKKKSNKGKGYATEGENPDKESSKIRSLTDNEQIPIKTPADKALSISPPHHQKN
jgi:hypothetical protein